MRKRIFCFATAFLLAMLILFSSNVSAHVLQIDGTIGAVLHIDPDDEPLAGDPATLNFEFKDSDEKFSLENCDCTVSIVRNNESLFDQKLVSTSSLVSIPYVFPDKAIYTIIVTGISLTENFKPFTLKYDIRVDTQGNQKIGLIQQLFKQHLAHIIFFGAAIIVAVGIILNEKRKERKMVYTDDKS